MKIVAHEQTNEEEQDTTGDNGKANKDPGLVDGVPTNTNVVENNGEAAQYNDSNDSTTTTTRVVDDGPLNLLGPLAETVSSVISHNPDDSATLEDMCATTTTGEEVYTPQYKYRSYTTMAQGSVICECNAMF